MPTDTTEEVTPVGDQILSLEEGRGYDGRSLPRLYIRRGDVLKQRTLFELSGEK